MLNVGADRVDGVKWTRRGLSCKLHVVGIFGVAVFFTSFLHTVRASLKQSEANGRQSSLYRLKCEIYPGYGAVLAILTLAHNQARCYIVNGGGQTVPDWLAAKKKGERRRRNKGDDGQGMRLIQVRARCIAIP